MGTLYYGDNLPILRDHNKDESVDLVYLDPPFKSDANYNAFFQGKSGASAAISHFQTARSSCKTHPCRAGKNSLNSSRGVERTSRAARSSGQAIRRKSSSTVAGLFPAFVLCNVLDEAGQIEQNQPACHHD